MIRASALALLALAPPAGAFELAFPLGCTLGESCYIQQGLDHDPGPGATDFTCGPLSYDGHDGTDFALPSRAAMAAGVDVLAAAAGTVKGLRDGIEDFAPVIAGKECGNGVVIDHGQGWETQYCHLKQGSVRVVRGERVDIGTPLGQVGQSGMAEFPHLHLSVRQNGQELDPFSPGAPSCGAGAGDLWATDIALQPGGLLALGIADHVPQFDAIKAGGVPAARTSSAPALVLWAHFFGPRAGDALLMELTGPDGMVVQDRVALEKTQSMAFRAIGRKVKTAGWAAGDYVGKVRLMRGAVEIDAMEIRLQISP